MSHQHPVKSKSCLVPTTGSINQTYLINSKSSDLLHKILLILIDSNLINFNLFNHKCSLPSYLKDNPGEIECIHHLLHIKPDCSMCKGNLTNMFLYIIQTYKLSPGTMAFLVRASPLLLVFL